MPSRRRYQLWFAALIVGSATLLALLSSSCVPRPSDDGGGRCPAGEEYTNYQGRSTCRTTCASNDPCAPGERCFNGVCVQRADTSGSDTATDTGTEEVDTGRCAENTRLTIYRGVKKCRPYCEGDGDCNGDLECLDGHCVDRSLQRPDTGPTDTGTDTGPSDTGTDTGQEVTPGSLSCHRIIRCQQACSTRSCSQNVEDEGSIQGTQDYNDYISCLNNNCPQGDQRCIDTNCGTEQDACFPPNVSGQNLNCEEFFLCFANCPSGDRQCEQDCQNRATQTALSQYQSIVQCVNNECPQGGDTCLQNAISGTCSTDWETCFACP